MDRMHRQVATFYDNCMQAAILGDLKRVKEIVKDIKKHSCDYLIDLTTEEDGYNMLHFAVCYKRADIVKFLIENGASKSNSYNQLCS